MTLLLMAAGRGSRYGKLKQFDDLGPQGEFLMEFSMYDAIENGFDHIVVITQKANIDFLKEHMAGRLPEGVKFDVVSQELTDLPASSTFEGQREKPWGTAHAVWSARNVIKGPFAVINADDYYGKSAFEAASNFIKNSTDDTEFALMGYTLKDTLSEYGSVSRGVCKMDGDNNFISVDERLKLEKQGNVVKDTDTGLEFSGEELVSMNFWVCRPSFFDYVENEFEVFLKDEDRIKNSELYLPIVIQDMYAEDKANVRVVPANSNWFGVTYSEDRQFAVDQLQEMTQNNGYKTPLWN
ncbi:sugar phosphate nucleotidyltransferase [uncultured Kriegella sp.]|uniref:nucleotidyltransferase family protein n=1 Tax=uncultured Kriegella sp. TaxID=1798910 RepID=UPI0030DBD533|tara:strand:+ start:35397 stop:36284 length:888 start_codon:yes stop_codon:yes gene_type:complete